MTFGFIYEMTHKRGVTYKAIYKFDVVKRGKRNIWIYKEESPVIYIEIQ